MALGDAGAAEKTFGRALELATDRALAHDRHARSLAALRRLANPPPGSVESLTHLVERTRPGAPEEVP